MKKTKVIILFGGRSAEHEISLLSARNVLAALDRDRFEPSLIGIDRAGRWHRESERTLAAATGDPRALGLDQAAPIVGIEEGLAATGTAAAPRLVPPVAMPAGDDVVVFPVLHGTFGEDGTVQGLLELGDVAYVGSGVLGSAVGMDKDIAKRLLRDAGIPIVDFAVVTAAAELLQLPATGSVATNVITREVGMPGVSVSAARSFFADSETRPFGVTGQEQQDTSCSSGVNVYTFTQIAPVILALVPD